VRQPCCCEGFERVEGVVNRRAECGNLIEAHPGHLPLRPAQAVPTGSIYPLSLGMNTPHIGCQVNLVPEPREVTWNLLFWTPPPPPPRSSASLDLSPSTFNLHLPPCTLCSALHTFLSILRPSHTSLSPTYSISSPLRCPPKSLRPVPSGWLLTSGTEVFHGARQYLTGYCPLPLHLGLIHAHHHQPLPLP
jgi:hypothetical protein